MTGWRAHLAGFFVAVVALLGAAEFFAWLYLRHVVALDWSPAWQGTPSEERRIGAWRVPHGAWGNWRLPNALARQESACFSVALRSNDIGARDRDRTRGGAGRIVVLGDSFAEGWGVEEDQRVSNLLEQRTGREFLNFGAATHGPLQYQLVYEQLASRHAHEHVLILLLADNDFTDNDFEFWRHKTSTGGRARPYYERLPDGTYRALYPVPARAEAPAPRVGNMFDTVGRAIRQNSWALRAGEHVSAMLRGQMDYAGYFDVTDDQLNAVAWTLGEIRRLATPARKITIALIPRLNDFHRPGNPNLPARLAARAQAHDITVIDLLPALRAAAPNPAALYLRCDGHWNVAGNRAAAEALRASGRFD